jgi:hypothetical protein
MARNYRRPGILRQNEAIPVSCRTYQALSGSFGTMSARPPRFLVPFQPFRANPSGAPPGCWQAPPKTAAAARCYQLRSFGPPGGPQDDKCRVGVWMKSDSGGCYCHPERSEGSQRLRRAPKTAGVARCYQLRSFGPPGGPQDDKCRAGVWAKSDSGRPGRRGRRRPGLVRIDSVWIAYVRDYFRRKA